MSDTDYDFGHAEKRRLRPNELKPRDPYVVLPNQNQAGQTSGSGDSDNVTQKTGDRTYGPGGVCSTGMQVTDAGERYSIKEEARTRGSIDGEEARSYPLRGAENERNPVLDGKPRNKPYQGVQAGEEASGAPGA